jgi:hypothetical protein
VRADHHRCERRVRAGPGGHDVADGVERHVEAEVAHPGDHEIASGAVLVGEREPGIAPFAVRAVDPADLAEFVETAEQATDVDAKR